MLAPLRRALAVVAVAGLAAGTLAGCFLFEQTEESEPAPADVSAELQPFYEQVLEWTDCDNGAQCATAQAPRDWDEPDFDDSIELALSRHTAASGESQGSLFFNPGGPGGSGVDYVRDYPEGVVSERVRDQYDLVGWDPRGVGASSAVVCYTDGADMDEFLYGIPEAQPDTPEYTSELEAAGAAFGAACEANTDEGLLPVVDTLSTVRDLDLLRGLVGDEQLNYFGMSYGTKIGAIYADEYPDHVGRMVLDGVLDPALTSFEVVEGQTRGFDRVLRSYLEQCQSTGCPFTGDPDVDIATLALLYDALDETPIEAEDGRMLDSAVLDTAIASALYEDSYWEYLSAMFVEISQGVPDTAFALADAYYGRDENGEYASHFFESFIAIQCVDYTVETDLAVLERDAEALRAITPLVSDQAAMVDPICGQWPAEPTDSRREVTGSGAAPILVIGTAQDPATPYEWAVSLSERLESAVLISYDGDDHIAYDEGDPCVNDPVDAYLLDGTVPGADPRCGY